MTNLRNFEEAFWNNEFTFSAATVTNLDHIVRELERAGHAATDEDHVYIAAASAGRTVEVEGHTIRLECDGSCDPVEIEGVEYYPAAYCDTLADITAAAENIAADELEDLSDNELEEAEHEARTVGGAFEKAWRDEQIGRYWNRVIRLRDSEREADKAENDAFSEYVNWLKRRLEDVEDEETREELRDACSEDEISDETKARLIEALGGSADYVLEDHAQWRRVAEEWSDVSSELAETKAAYNALAHEAGISHRFE